MAERPVVIAVGDAATREALARLAALAGVAPQAVTTNQLQSRWMAAPGVLVDVPTARWCVESALPRRPGVLVVAPVDPSAPEWATALALGAECVVVLPREERAVLDWLAALTEPARAGRVVCCVPARGGCGSSTLAAALAFAAGSRAHDVLLVDADPCAGGLQLLAGMEHVTGARWDEFRDAAGVLPAAVLVDALPAVGRVRLLSCDARSRRPLPADAVDAVIAAGRRGHDLVVVDAPNVFGELTTRVTAAADLVVVSVAADVRSVAAATGFVAELNERCDDVRLVVRHPGPGGLRPRDVGEAVSAPVAAVWRRDRRVAGIVERGRFSRAWRHTNLAEVTGRLLDAATDRAARSEA